jgi:hypothetical protein
MIKGAKTPRMSTGAAVVLKVHTCKKRTRPVNKEPVRLHARAIKRILDRQTGELVGWLYEWNTGEIVPRWKTNAQTDVIYE